METPLNHLVGSSSLSSPAIFNRGVAQLARAAGFEPEGRGFDSYRPCQDNLLGCCVSDSDSGCSKFKSARPSHLKETTWIIPAPNKL